MNGAATRNRDAVAGWSFLTPTLVLVTLFTLAPVLFAFYAAFHKMDIVSGQTSWAGVRNLGYLWDDDKFWAACRNTLRYVVVVVPLQTALALALACLLNGRVRMRRAFVTLFFLPTLTSSAAMTMIFMWLFNNNGLVTQALQAHFGITVRFLSDPHWALAIIMLMNVFSTTPQHMVVYLAGLQEIPQGLYEAMTLDGAGPIARHWHISVPQLTPITFYVVTMGLIGCFQVFDQAFILSGGDGGPENSTLTFTLLIYQLAFKTYNTMGLACALAVVLTLIILGATLLLRRFVKAEGLNA
ncbi:MAG: sugar ABC transporter permease [Burkholderiales bacterium]|nr:sugar ABC transporter permease [Burkholderiales bacterium]MDE1928277.1 sugar ABC transporter permease [Burkholderiales bacterium]MDE2158036.1 sugar ABC transporter permease [Burkholderiales bacterium]MDE2504206.1 sugar ABC transporter permease [Burkholderiales bacterium]